MKFSRRSFLAQGTTGAAALLLPIPALASLNEADLTFFEKFKEKSADELAGDEDFWTYVRACYSLSPALINLNNGGVSPQPKQVQEAHIRNYEYCNEGPSYYMWRILDKGREVLREKLALVGGVSAEEIAINRNSTEGLNSVIFGLNMKAGDEVVLSKYDYPNMINAWKQREKRDGIKINWVDFDVPNENEDELVKKYTEAITPKTRVVHIVHIINWCGQIMPVKKIADAAKKRGCDVLVDGAHSFAHFEFLIPDLNCDYFATSLHKWMGAPFGSGMLYIRKEKIKEIWPLLSSPEPESGDIRKFEALGTRSFASEMAIANAVDFHSMIGGKRKEARLKYLKNYWISKAKQFPKVKVYTPSDKYSCAIGIFSIEGRTPEETEGYLLDKKRVHGTCIKWEKINGVRITPNVYTSTEDLDMLVQGIKELAS